MSFKDNNLKILKHHAFTLSEVLIAMLVIGVIAAITIPTVINNSLDKELKTALKKTNSELSQIANKTSIELGGFKDVFTTNEQMRDFFLGYLKSLRTCDTANTVGTCWSSTEYYLDKSASTPEASSGAILLDGMSFRFKSLSADCSDIASISADFPVCGKIFVDVNGMNKGPNVYGRDLFGYWVTNNFIKPMGFQGDANSKSDCDNYGLGCTLTRLME